MGTQSVPHFPSPQAVDSSMADVGAITGLQDNHMPGSPMPTLRPHSPPPDAFTVGQSQLLGVSTLASGTLSLC